jgi:hypothetical protein
MRGRRLLPDGENELKELARELGVSTEPGADASDGEAVLLPALRARILQALNYRTARRAIIVSEVAICVSVLSAIFAFLVLLKS